ncbi:MAG: DUF4012 domain-containing protein, partial [Anaerolineae bacterium]|nr:DUF4012 domain-containing protein [Anaerolineae bacterium]
MMALLPDSTETTRHKVRERRRRKRGWFHRLRRRLKWTTVLIVVVATVVVVVVGSLVLVTDATNKVQSALTSLQRVLLILNGRTGADLTLDDFDRLQASVRDLNGSLNAARGQLVFMRPLTDFNKNLSATFQAMDAAGDLSAAADTVLNGLRPTVFFMFYGEDDPNATAPLSSGERVVELLRIGRTQFATASHLLDSAQERIDNLELGDLSPDLVLYFNDLNQYADELTRANDILLQSPELLTTALGLSQTQAYLILSQNSDELRPSGGYIGTYGWMTLRNGRITDYNYSPTTATSPNPPPNTLADQIDIPDWWLHYNAPIYAAWDGSWSVDFGETAERAIWYYNNGNNPQAPVGGAIGIDIVGFEYILEALDSVVVPGYDEVITTENFRQVVYEIRESSAGDSPHKRFIARLYQQIFADWQNASTDPALSTEILGAVLRALREKHI